MKKWLICIFAVIVAITASQMPEFAQQYTQRLSGALDEVERQISDMDDRASLSGQNRYDYVRMLKNSENEILRVEGGYLETLLGRRVFLKKSRAAMENPHPVMLLPAILQHGDRRIYQAVLSDYKPAIPLTRWGFFYAMSGFCATYFMIWFLSFLLYPPFLRSRTA